jgi:hypothetical protein
MKVLVVYRQKNWKPQRKAIQDHLLSFGRYLKDCEVVYCNLLTGLPAYLKWVQFDAILLHTTLMDRDPRQPPWWGHIARQVAPLKTMSGVKIAFPQDEWENSETLWQLFRITGTHTLFTCMQPEHVSIIYPEKESGITRAHSTLPGFVDDAFIARTAVLSKEIGERSIDIGYRARNMGFLCGRLGQIKTALAEQFAPLDGVRGLKIDVSTKGCDVFYGDDWIRFLLRCRAVLGCPGGSSLMDLDGSIRRSVEAYLKKHPEATFEEVEVHCFQGKEGQVCISAISPRHFECAITRTCQVLVEGSYSGDAILQPGVHYIPLKRDYSNIDAVLEQVADASHCERIVERAYQDLVVSGRYTYTAFAEQVQASIRDQLSGVSAKQSLRFGVVKLLLKLRGNFKAWERIRWRYWYLRHMSIPKWFERISTPRRVDKAQESKK